MGSGFPAHDGSTPMVRSLRDLLMDVQTLRSGKNTAQCIEYGQGRILKCELHHSTFLSNLTLDMLKASLPPQKI